MFMFLSGKSLVSVVLLSVVLLGLQGCGGTNPSRSEDVTQNSSSSSPASRMPPGQANYSKILNQMGLGRVFTFNEPHETVTNGKVTSITVTLSPKDINDDANTGQIIKETKLLFDLGNKVSEALSKETGISPSRVETIVLEKKCKAHIIRGKVIPNCDRDAPIILSSGKKEFVNILKGILQNSTSIDDNTVRKMVEADRANKSFNKQNLTSFCNNNLKSNLKKYGYQSNCIITTKVSNGMDTYIINDVRTKKFITNDHYEEFDIQVFNSPELSSKNGTVHITAKYEPTLLAMVRPETYHQNVNDLKAGSDLIHEKEEVIAEWLREFAEQNNGKPLP